MNKNQEDIETRLRALPLPELPSDSAQRLEELFARELALPALPPDEAQRLETGFVRALSHPRRSYAAPLGAAAAVLLLALGAGLWYSLGQAPAAQAVTPAVSEQFRSAELLEATAGQRRYLVHSERRVSLPAGDRCAVTVTIPETTELTIPDNPI